MQIELVFTCRDCGRDNTTRTDTADYGVLADGEVTPAHTVDLLCFCGHISGQIGLGYRYGQEHRPAWERE